MENNQSPTEGQAPPQDDPDADANALESTEAAPAPAVPVELVKRKLTLKQKLAKFNLYLIGFIFILTVGVAIIVVSYFQGKKSESKATIATQNLTQDALDTLASTDASVGDPKQLLNVQSNAVFAGQVLVRGATEIAGNLRVAGTALVNGIDSTGPASFQTAQVNQNLSVGGDTTVQGGLAIQKSLQVTGGGSFGGPVTAAQITTSAFQLDGDLRLTNHIIAGGATPGRTNGTALGAGGTSTVGGSDTGGTVTINTGGGPGAGCFATITFVKKYNNTPRVLITPVSDAAGAINYYVTRTTTSFNICTSTPPPANASFAFDYFIFE